MGSTRSNYVPRLYGGLEDNAGKACSGQRLCQCTAALYASGRLQWLQGYLIT